ncbi:MAG: AAA family ATPase, partial [Acidimicrobiales bacterium]
MDFRSFRTAELDPDPEGTTVLTGANGTGKTSLLEAVGYAATLRSFRGAAREAMVRTGAERAVVRATFESEGRPVLVEAELAAGGRSRAQLNRQPVRSRHELAQAVTVTVFSPEDLGLVQGPPAGRRDLLDQALAALDPQA